MMNTVDGRPMQDDGVHLGPEGSAAAADWLAPTIKRAARTADARAADAAAAATTTTTAPVGVTP